MEERSWIRIVVVAALLAAIVGVAAVALLGGEGYRVTARLTNASQLVKGNLVTVAGEKVGSVEDIRLADDGLAEIELAIDGEYAPLRQGTRAIIRQLSLSGVANRYVDLQLGGATGPELDDGDTIPAIDTQSNVDLDALFNTFDPVARTAVARSIRLFRDFNRGNEEAAGEALRYLSPALASSSRLFAEINRNRRDFERFVTATGRLTSDIGSRDDDVAGLISNLSTTMQALASERDDLGRGLELLPDTLRRANTTFVNLRASLDDLDPLVETSKPAVRALRPLLGELRPFSRDVVPTARALSNIVRQPNPGNDLVELFRELPKFDEILNQTKERNGAQRRGANPEITQALTDSVPQFAFFRPYSTDLIGWFDDFSHSGVYDALGGFSRAGLQLNQFTVTPTLENALLPVPPALRESVTFGQLRLNRNNRCPGSAERPAPDGSNPYIPTQDFNCDRRQQPQGETAGP
jgi:phospholipid/cholesterol/gamma-HCH transport system substrate-binding protein